MSRGSCQQGKAQNKVIHPCLLLPAPLPVVLQAPEPWLELVLVPVLDPILSLCLCLRLGGRSPLSHCCSWEPLGVRTLVIPPPHSSMVPGLLGSRLAWGRGDTWGLGVSGRTGSVGGAQGGDPEEGIWGGDV